MAKKAKYKPLLFTTTVRNPKRLKSLLNIFQNYNSQILTNDLATEIMGEIIRYGLYRPTRGITNNIEQKWGAKRISDKSSIGEEKLNDKEVVHLINRNPQLHKEAGFEEGWPSRFATVFDFAKELGFVYFNVNEKIFFSEIGLKLANSVEITSPNDEILFDEPHPEFEQQAFLHAMAKSQRSNPFVRVLNDNIPLILLLQVIQKLNNDKEFNDAGISRLELPLVLYWQDNDAESLYKRIKKLRANHGYNPSWEVITEICRDEIMAGEDIKREDRSIMNEYPDEFIRKMRLTGVISLRGGGRFIDINRNEQAKVDYILKEYSDYKKYSTEKEYFKYMSTTDNVLISLKTKPLDVTENDKLLEKWVNHYTWEIIKSELKGLAIRKNSTDPILKFLTHPIRLEFLTSLAIKANYKDLKIVPNYPCDDEGIPTSTAGGQGNQGDIECFEDENGVLVEVTMSGGRTQTMMEVWPIERHLEEFDKKIKANSMCHFIAPNIYADSKRQIKYVKDDKGLRIEPRSVDEFITFIETNDKLFEWN